MYATNYFEERMLNLMHGVNLTPPTNLYLELFITNPGDEGTGGTPISYSGYSRRQITFGEPTADGNGMSISNNTLISFPESPINAGTVNYVGVYDNNIGGYLLLYAQLDTPLIVNANVSPVFRIGQVKWLWSGNLSPYYRNAIMKTLGGVTRPTCYGFSQPYIGLLNGENEVSGNNYARIQVNMTDPVQTSSGAAHVENTEEVTSPVATGNWGLVNRIGIYSAATGGNPYGFINISPAVSMTAGYAAIFHAGDLQFNIN